MKYNKIFFLLMLAGSATKSMAEPTFAERLGWPADSKVVIFHCDDAGMSHGSNLGAIEALEKGVVTSVSTMMPCSWVPELATYLKAHPTVDNGLHLTLTSEWDNYRWGPLAGKAAVPGLVDEQGCLWHSVPDVVQHASADEFEKEIRAQIDRAQTLGIPITHLDTHMGTVYAKPEFVERYVKVGIEKHIPIMIMGGHMTYMRKTDGARIEPLLKSGVVEKVWNGGLPVLDDLFSETYDVHKFEDKKKQVIDILHDMKPGVMQIIIHCSKPTEEFPVFTGSSETRLSDLRVACDPDVKAAVEKEHIILTTWRELGQRRDKVGK